MWWWYRKWWVLSRVIFDRSIIFHYTCILVYNNNQDMSDYSNSFISHPGFFLEDFGRQDFDNPWNNSCSNDIKRVLEIENSCIIISSQDLFSVPGDQLHYLSILDDFSSFQIAKLINFLQEKQKTDELLINTLKHQIIYNFSDFFEAHQLNINHFIARVFSNLDIMNKWNSKTLLIK